MINVLFNDVLVATFYNSDLYDAALCELQSEASKQGATITTTISVDLNLNDVDILDEAMTEWLDDTQLTDHLTDLGIAASTKINNLREGLLL